MENIDGEQSLHSQSLWVQDMLIDDFTSEELISHTGTRWRAVSDQVMGGVSRAAIAHEVVGERPCMRISGDVRLENNGGFIQAALDLHPENGIVDASGYTGIRIAVWGNSEEYAVHLRTTANVRSWQSYRSRFTGRARMASSGLALRGVRAPPARDSTR